MEELRIQPIRNGTVIDHIRQGQALNVLNILGVGDDTTDVVSVAMNVPSEALGTKDVVKIEGRELDSREGDIIALIAPSATVNVIRDYDVVDKYDVTMPDAIESVVACPNANCITNTDEPIVTRFAVMDGELRCDYCEHVITGDVTRHLR